MTKSELKTNMLVEMRNGRKYLVKRDVPATDLTYREESDLFIDEIEGYMSFSEYSEDLLCYDDDVNQMFYDWGRDEVAEGYDIMKVYTPCKIFAFTSREEFNLNNYELLWAREEPKDEPKEDSEIQELHKMVESIEWTLAEIKTVLERKEEERRKHNE
jgi:hypothetical protein